MKRHWTWMIGIGIGLLIVGYYISGVLERKETRPGVEQRNADRAPDFVLKDLNGRTVKLSQYRNRTVLLIFSTTWCTYCRDAIPYFKDLHARYGPKGLIILNIDIQEPREKVAAFTRQYNLPYPVLLDGQGDVMQAYGIFGVPARILIDDTGRIICHNCRTFDNLLEMRFANQPPKSG